MIRGDALTEAIMLLQRAVETADDLEGRAAASGWEGTESRTEPSVERIAELLARAATRLETVRDLTDSAHDTVAAAADESESTGAHRLAEELAVVAALVGDAYADAYAGRQELAPELASATALATATATATASASAAAPDRDPSPSLADPLHVRAPGNHKGPLGQRYRPGVHDPGNLFLVKERAIADWLLDRDPTVCIHRRTVEGADANPDAMVRKGPADGGTITEFKTPEAPPDRITVIAASGRGVEWKA